MKKKNDRPTSPPAPADVRTGSLHDTIARQARVLWENYGRPTARDESIWLEAERQVLGADRNVQQQAGGAVRAGQFSGTQADIAPPEGSAELRGRIPRPP
jgi:hypothetical protein